MVAREVRLEVTEAGRELGEGDAQRLHAALRVATRNVGGRPRIERRAPARRCAIVPVTTLARGARLPATRRVGPCVARRASAPVSGPLGRGRSTRGGVGSMSRSPRWSRTALVAGHDDRRSPRVPDGDPQRESAGDRAGERPGRRIRTRSSPARGDDAVRCRPSTRRPARPRAAGRGDGRPRPVHGQHEEDHGRRSTDRAVRPVRPGLGVPAEGRVQRRSASRTPTTSRRTPPTSRSSTSRTAPAPTSSRSGARATGWCSRRTPTTGAPRP